MEILNSHPEVEPTPVLLPHEANYIDYQIVILKARRDEKNQEYGDTVAASGGDWAFDDPASMAAAVEAHISDLQLNSLKHYIHGYEIMPYPESEKHVVVGSRVTLKTGDMFEEFDLVNINTPTNEVETVTVTSPLGKTLIGCNLGDTKTLEAPAGTWEFTIIDINNNAQRRYVNE